MEEEDTPYSRQIFYIKNREENDMNKAEARRVDRGSRRKSYL